MQNIRSYNDVAPFAGHIVAFQAQTYTLGGGNSSYLGISPSLMFGYVPRESQNFDSGKSGHAEKGYKVIRVIKQGEVPANCGLRSDILQEDSVTMRLATSAEISAIDAAIKAKKVYFEYHRGEGVEKLNY